MARGRIQMKRIENPVQRQVTFCKRRAGLFKKAKELSVLCDAEIGLFIFSSNGKLCEFATKGTMQGLVERYVKDSGGTQPDQATDRNIQPLDAEKQVRMLKQEIEILQKGISYMLGGGSGTMTLEELLVLEKYLEIWICNIRSTKMDIMFQEIQFLRNNEELLKAANKYLLEKMEGNTGVTDFASFATNIQNDSFSAFSRTNY
ncbi:hypothetical protein SLA2020_075060 [Shorea laevis]